MKLMRSIGMLVCAGVLALGRGCAHELTYVPVGPGASGGPAAQYPVPPAAPQGEVYVTSFGFTDIDNGQGGSQRFLQARVAVSNGSGAPWELDGRQQFLVAPGQQPQPPAFLNTNVGAGPVYSIAAGAATVFDLYFTPPAGLARTENLAGFALDWSVNAGGQVVTNQTSFERSEGPQPSYDPYPPYVVVGLGFGYGWWYGPYYPYRHYPPVIRGYYFAPGHVHGGPWRGSSPGAWRGTPPGASGGWRGAPPATMRSAPGPRGGGWRGGGGRHR